LAVRRVKKNGKRALLQYIAMNSYILIINHTSRDGGVVLLVMKRLYAMTMMIDDFWSANKLDAYEFETKDGMDEVKNFLRELCDKLTDMDIRPDLYLYRVTKAISK